MRLTAGSAASARSRSSAARGRGLHRGVDLFDGAGAGLGQRRRLGLGEPVDADDDVGAALDAPAPLGERGDQRALEVPALHRGDHAAQVEDLRQFDPGTVHDGRYQPLHHLRAVEQVGVLQQVGLVREHLLHAQRPLLVPRPG